MSKPSDVFFIKEITPDNIVKIYNQLGKKLVGPVCVKIHSGEAGNQNFLGPDLFGTMYNALGTDNKPKFCECNTAYPGQRNTTEKHVQLMTDHKWSVGYESDIMDEYSDVAQDLVLKYDKGFKIKQDYVGAHLANYNSMLVLR
ncbi:MAG: DUF362 domain-containing protein [archaeon]|nr:DUF362 domain-containing protein [archaeon]